MVNHLVIPGTELILKDLYHYFINDLMAWLRLCNQVGRIPVQNLQGAWSGLDTPNFYEAPGDI